jgi:hypothetical protein
MTIVRLDREVYSYYLRSGADLGSSTLLYIVQEAGVLVGYIAEVLVGLCVGNPSWTSSSSLFSAGYPMGPASIVTRHLIFATVPAVPIYLRWSEHPITFNRDDHPDHVIEVG